jgi:hypothetical protein
MIYDTARFDLDVPETGASKLISSGRNPGMAIMIEIP